MTAPSPWVTRFASRIRASGRVLDVAAGSGRHTHYLRKLGYRVVAVDREVSRLAGLSRDAAVSILEADLEDGTWPFDEERFDGIIVTNYLHRPLLPVLIDSLAPAGVLIYETFGEGNEKYGGPSNPDFLLREGELLAAFCPPLERLAYEHVHEGMPRPSVRQRICAVRR